MIKRLFDIFFSLFGLILVSPLLLVIAVLIKRESPGPAFYRGERVGKNGKTFKIFKFRTMVPDAEKLGGPSTATDDPRLLKIGLFLKKYQLDELPQLINVMAGDMSLVGPRPEVPSVVELLTEKEKKIILPQKPGMVDLASIWDFHEGERLTGKIDPHKVYLEEIWPIKKKLQIYYIKNQNIWLDIRIILRTIFKIFHLNCFTIKIHVGEEVFNL
jgi:lipopolysaccharide/colanic/teichoic acid biosynthesis glycosyltransferase